MALGKLKSSQSSSASVLKSAITVSVISVIPAVAAVAGNLIVTALEETHHVGDSAGLREHWH